VKGVDPGGSRDVVKKYPEGNTCPDMVVRGPSGEGWSVFGYPEASAGETEGLI